MTEERSVFETPLQHIELLELPSEDLILDIGGGGEGLASRIGKQRVCSVDFRISEIREAQIHDAPANWFVCDGRALCFVNSSFDYATLWFSLGYMRDDVTKKKVLNEVFRVLKPGQSALMLEYTSDNSPFQIYQKELFSTDEIDLPPIFQRILNPLIPLTKENIISTIEKTSFKIVDVVDVVNLPRFVLKKPNKP